MHGINFHSYANNSELYLHSKADEDDLNRLRVARCTDAVDRWMSSNRLKLNADKTVYRTPLDAAACQGKMWQYASRSPRRNISAERYLSRRNPGCRTVDDAVCACSDQSLFRQTGAASRYSQIIDRRDAYAFINSRLDYCNSVMYGVGAKQRCTTVRSKLGHTGWSTKTKIWSNHETICTGYL